MTSFESVENLLLDLTNTGSGSVGGGTDLDNSPLCRRRSAPSIDLSPIHPVTDHEKVTNYETAFGPDNRTVTRVYYTNGVAMDYSKEEEAEVFAPIETHFESSEPLQVPKLTECQSYQVNYAHVRPVMRRKSDGRKNGEKKAEAYRRRSYGPSSVGLVSSQSCGDCTVQQSSRSYNGYLSSRTSSQGEESEHTVPTRTTFPRSKSSASLHTCAHQDFQAQLLAECQREKQQQQVYQSCESLPGRSLSLSDLMHAGTVLKSKLKKCNTATGRWISCHERVYDEIIVCHWWPQDKNIWYGNLLKIDKAYKKSTGLHIFEPAYMYCILMKYRYIYIIVIRQVQIPVLSLSHSWSYMID